jgi:hypothetical protein
MQRPEWAPGDIDTDTPTAARVYDYLLGGCHNFAADRAFGDQIIAMVPDAPVMAQSNRAFLRRAATFCAESGIRQILDIGSGIPTLGNVHEVAQQIDPGAHVVYVDIDPVAVEHSRALLQDNERATVVQADMRDPESILRHPEVRRLIDFTQPVALLMVAVLHFVKDEDEPYELVKKLVAALPAGSLLVLSHGSSSAHSEVSSRAQALYERSQSPGQPRRLEQVIPFFDGLEIVEPGVVWAPLWHPENTDTIPDDPSRSCILVGVGRKA